MTIRRGHQEDNDRAMTILNTADVGDRDVMERGINNFQKFLMNFTLCTQGEEGVRFCTLRDEITLAPGLHLILHTRGFTF